MTTSDDTPEDYSIYVHIDGISGAMPWRLKDYGDDGALNDEDIQEIADRAGIERTLIEKLSVRLGHCLDRDAHANFIKIRRSTAGKRGQETIRVLKKRIAAMNKQISKVAEDIRALEPSFASEDAENSKLVEVQRLAVGIARDMHQFETILTGMEDRPGVAFDMSPLDKRTVVDRRRLDVVFQCCFTWEIAKEPIRYNTATQGPYAQLKGELADFIQSIVLRLTDPPQEIHGGTLRKDFDYFREDPYNEDPEELELGNIDPSWVR